MRSGIAVGNDASTFVASHSATTIDFGGGRLTSAGGQDVFIAKLDAKGDHVWSRRFGDGAEQIVGGLATVGDRLLAAGYFAGTLDLGTGTGTSLSARGSHDLFVTQLCDPQ